MVKIGVFVLLALFAFQGFEAKSYEHQNEHDVQGIIDNIKEIVAKIENFIEHLGDNMADIIQKLKEKINEIIKNIDFGDLIANIEKKIEEILETAGIDVDAAKACIANERPTVEQLMQTISMESQKCEQDAMAKSDELTQKMQEVFEEAMSVKDDVTSRVQQCLKDNQGNTISLAACLVGQFQPIYAEAMKLKDDINETVQLAQKVSQEVQESMTACMAVVQQHAVEGERAIVAEVKQCLLAPQTLREQRDFTDIIEEIKKFVAKVEDFIKNIGNNMGDLVQKLKDKIKEIIDGIDLKGLVDTIERKIQELLEAAGIDVEAAKACITKERPAVEMLMHDVVTESQRCQSDAMAQADKMTQEFQAVFDEAVAVKDDVSARFTKCVTDNQGSNIKIAVCLAGQIKPIYEEAMKVKDDATAAYATAQKIAQEVQEMMQSCMTEVQKNLLEGEREIVSDVKKCLNTPQTFGADRDFQDIIEKIKEIMAKVQDFMMNIGNNMGELVQKLKDKIKEIIDNMNLPGLVDVIEKKVQELLEAAGIDVEAAKACITKERPAVEELVQNAISGSQKCQSDATAQADQITQEIQAVFKEAMDTKDDVSARVTKCINDNKDSTIKIAACLSGQIKPIYEEAMNVKNDVSTAFAKVQSLAQQIQQSMQTCMAAVQQTVLEGERAIVADVKKCVLV